jgi:ferrous iron transport protein A
MPLALLRPGNRARIVSLNGGRGFTRRLTSMGMHPGVELSVVRGGIPGPVVVKVQESRFAIGRGMAHRVFVEPLS